MQLQSRVLEVFPHVRRIGNELLEYRLQKQQSVPTRLRALFSWNINSWTNISSSRKDPKMRRCKKLLRNGPILLQETKWHACHVESVLQNLAGAQVVSSAAIPTEKEKTSGGVAIITPPGWRIEEEHTLLAGRAIMVLVRDRTAPFYLLSVYLHPNNTKRELAQVITAWQNIDQKTDRVLIAGDFNHADEKCPDMWSQFLRVFRVFDVHPTLATYHFVEKTFALDRCLVPEDWVTTARWNPVVRTLQSIQTSGHNIVKLTPKVRPVVLNNPGDVLHETISTEVFMPGKDGRVIKDNYQLNRLIRMLHVQGDAFSKAIGPMNGFRFGSLDEPSSSIPACTFDTFDAEPRRPPPEAWHDEPPIKRRKTTPKRHTLGSGQSLKHAKQNTRPETIQTMDESIFLRVPSNENYTDMEEEEPISQYHPNFSHLLCNWHMKISAVFWSWWRTMPRDDGQGTALRNRAFVKAKKFIHSNSEWVNIPVQILEDLVKESRGIVIANLEGLVSSQGSISVPRVHVQEMLEVTESYSTKVPYVPCDEANAQARGIGSMVAFWERMRNICPKVNVYNGPIYKPNGQQCVTSTDLDEAMLSTRDFWFQPPVEADPQWDDVLDHYASSEPWPDLPLPDKSDLLNTLLHTKDSAPGPDGLPYAAWRFLPEVTVGAMASFFHDIMEGSALPPLQVGVWIPKAKMGPEADCFRPLGMPDTLARLVDGTVAAKVMSATASNMHPSQTVMSIFKEPQRAVTGIQSILDSQQAACSLLADLSKAFERVNPHWILRILRIKSAPAWVLKYTKHVLFHRRVKHKVQGRLLPSRTILQGVDMGRSFSVFLFCLAMDPLFHYLNRIPKVLSVQAYVDDTTVVGDAQDLSWMCEVSSCYQKLHTAGFVIEPHQCYRCITNSVMKFSPRLISDHDLCESWPDLLSGPPFPTIEAALSSASRPGYNVAVLRLVKPAHTVTMETSKEASNSAGHLLANYSFAQSSDILRGIEVHSTLAFVCIKCACKSKSHVVTNFRLRPGALRLLDKSAYGIHAIAPHAPSLGLALTGRWEIAKGGVWKETQLANTWKETVPAPYQKYQRRITSFKEASLSIIARCTAYNSFIVSVMPYTASYFGLSTQDLNQLRQAAVKFVLKRHWLEAEIMPYVLRLIGVAPLMDPALAATVSAFGLYLREGNTVEDIVNHTAISPFCNNRQRSVVLDLFHMWEPYIKIESLFQAAMSHGDNIRKKITKLKTQILEGMLLIARNRLRHKIRTEGWSKGVSAQWVELVSEAPKKWCNGIARYTLLRWAVNQDDDVWLQRRGTRHQQKCHICKNNGETFPDGYNSPPLCEACVCQENVNPIEVCPYGASLQATVAGFYQPHWDWIPQSEEVAKAKVAAHGEGLTRCCEVMRGILPISHDTCRACGCGDNTIGHWSRWCVVPLMVAWIIIRPPLPPLCLNQLACHSTRCAAICTLVIAAFRRLLRQEGAFYHQTTSQEKSVWWWIENLLTEVSQDATQELAVDFHGVLNSGGHCLVNSRNLCAKRVMPVDLNTMHLPPMMCTVTTSGTKDECVAMLSFDSVEFGILKAMQSAPPELAQNVTLRATHCTCGEYHIGLYLTKDVIEGDILVPSDFGSPKIFAQFDGSAYRESQLGGAGACLYQIASSGLQLINWGSIALPRCSDNVEAEVSGAELALHLYEQYTARCRDSQVTPLPLDRIQGDIKPLITHLQFQSRFRRKDLIPAIDRFLQKRSRLAPYSVTEYRPREANFIADFLAGQGSQTLLQLIKTKRSLPNGPMWVDVDPPYELLMKKGAEIVGHHSGGKVVLVLQEVPGCSFDELAKIAEGQSIPTQRLLRQIAASTHKITRPLCVEYIASNADGLGRLYAQQACGQKLPKLIRKLVYGRTHKEVDMSGAHYEIIRRLLQSPSLPPVGVFRSYLQEAWGPELDEEKRTEIKRAALRIINTSAAAAATYYASTGLPLPSKVIALSYELEAARDTVRNEWASRLRPQLQGTYANRNFFVLEEIEQHFMTAFLQEIQMRVYDASILWLHDGIWVPSSISDSLLRQAEVIAARKIGLPVDKAIPIMRISDLKQESLQLWQNIQHVVPPPLFPVPLQLKPPIFTKGHPAPKYRRKRMLEGSCFIHFGRRTKARRRY